MQHAAALYILPLLLITFSCDSSQKEVDNKNTDSTKKTVMVDDTMPDVPIPPPAPAPGTARIEAKIISIQEPHDENELFIIQLQPVKVLGYGSSTPALNISDTLVVTAAKLPVKLNADEKFIIVISHQRKIFGEQALPTWQIIKVETDTTNRY